ncbi:MAG: 6-carboxytetrahydropterin synthase QueD [Nitrospirae bacterium]|nr:6-carboxytetrahydropterin synthase QueD [Nitrospirota bacterium]
MFRVTRILNFCYGHRLLNYEGKCKHPHGHNGRVEIELTSDKLDKRGMVVDFGDIKRVVQEWIDRELDHKMILRKDDPLVSSLSALGEPYFTMDVNPTAENLAKLIFDFVSAQQYPVSTVRLWETENSFATYSGTP